jgi:hypothetical protein
MNIIKNFIVVLALFSLQLFSDDIPGTENKAMYGFNEKTVNWRLNPCRGGLDYSSRISLYRNDNFSSGIIIEYVLNINPEPDAIDSESFTYTYTPAGWKDAEYSLFYINYNF